VATYPPSLCFISSSPYTSTSPLSSLHASLPSSLPAARLAAASALQLQQQAWTGCVEVRGDGDTADVKHTLQM
jgi:hypothetical protein